MKWTIIAAIILAVVLAGISHKHTAPSPAGVAPVSSHAVHSSGSDGIVSAVCLADGTPTQISPSTAHGRAEAARLCAVANSDAQTVASKLNAEGR